MSKSLAIIIALGLLLPSLSSAATYTVTDLGTLGDPIDPLSFGYAINNHGQVTGYSFVPGSHQQDVFLYDGTMHDLGIPGWGYGINDSGNVAGTSAHAFLYDGTMHDLGTLGGTSSEARGINGSNQVTGYSSLAVSSGSHGQHAFLYDGTMHDLGTLGRAIAR